MDLRLVIYILWGVVIVLTVSSAAVQLTPIDTSLFNKFLALVIYAIFAPIFCAYTALDNILCMILPPGWDDDDERKL